MTSLDGVVTSGLGQGAYFMRLSWVQDAVRRLIGFTPYPGTLNVRLNAEMVGMWRRIQESHAIVLEPPPREPCGARLVSVTVTPDVEAAVIVPDVTRYGEDLLELIAATHLRSSLGLRDGDRVTLQLRSAQLRPGQR